MEFVEEQIAKLDGYHRQRLIQTFRAALSVDVRPFLSRPAGQEFVREKVAENVSLIKTIPPRFHDGLRERKSPRRSLRNAVRSAPATQADSARPNTGRPATTCGG